MAVWNPLLQQSVESDTTFKPDLTSVATITAGGGFLDGGNDQTNQSMAGSYDFGPGKFTPAVRPKKNVGGGAFCVFYPCDGLIPTNDWTIEWWMKRDEAWTVDTNAPLFGVNSFAESRGGNYIDAFMPIGGSLRTNIGTMRGVPGRAQDVSWSPATTSVNLINLDWNNFAITFKDGTVKIYVNGVLGATLTGLTGMLAWTDQANHDGIQIGGYRSNNNGVWTSDLRISATARTPGVDPAPLNSLTGALTVNVGSTIGSVPDGFSGMLKPAGAVMRVQDAKDIVASVRDADTITQIPIKDGAPDGQHTWAGASGQFSYNPAPWDRLLGHYYDIDVEVYSGADSCPHILGGSAQENPDVFPGGSFSTVLPNDFDKFATIMADYVDYADQTSRPVGRIGDWNEPDINFWNGTQAQKVDLQRRVAAAVHAADSNVKVGAGETASMRSDWMQAHMAAKGQQGAQYDFYAFHDYDGNLATLDAAKGYMDHYAALYSTSALPMSIGEFNWQVRNGISGDQRWAGGWWHLKAFGGAFTTAYYIHALEVGGYERMMWSHSIGVYGPLRTSGSFGAMQLVGHMDEPNPTWTIPSDIHWAPFNALKGWNKVIHSQKVALPTKNLPPGVWAMATKHPTEARVGIAFANYGYANRNSRTVNITLQNLPADTYRIRRYVVDEAHSRWEQSEALGQPGESVTAGAPFDALHVAEDRTEANPTSMSVSLPKWSSTFVEIQSTAIVDPDTTPPETNFTVTPSDGPSTSASFEFTSSEGGSTFDGKLDTGGYAPITSPHGLSNLSIGSHTFSVKATDLDDNEDPTPAVHTWTVTPTPPPTNTPYSSRIVSRLPLVYYRLGEQTPSVASDVSGGAHHGIIGPNVQLAQSGSLSGDSDDAVRFPGGTRGANSFITIPSSMVLPAGSSVAITFRLNIATADVADMGLFAIGNVDVPNLCSAHLLSDGTLLFDYGHFTGGRVSVDYDSYLDEWTTVAMMFDTSTNEHSIALNGTEVASVINTVAPSINLTGGYLGGQTYVGFGNAFEGYMDEFAIIPRALTPTELSGDHTAATTGSGGSDTTPPVTTILTAPNDGPATSVQFTFSADEAATFQSRVDGGSYTSATSPKTVSGLSIGEHTFDVRATDTATNVGNPDSHTWEVTAPSVTSDEQLWLTDPRIGIEMNLDGQDQGQKLQDAVNLANTGDGILCLPPGRVESHSVELVVPPSVQLIGSGAFLEANRGSVLIWRELGTGKFPIKMDPLQDYPSVWKDFAIRGPYVRNNMGDDVSDMHGPRVFSHASLTSVFSSGFKSGFVLMGDHHLFTDVRVQNNAYGLYMGMNHGYGVGNQTFVRLSMNGNKRAGIAIGTSQTLNVAAFIAGDFSTMPVAIYRFDEGPGSRWSNFLSDTSFVRCSFEQMGDAVIYDSVGDGVMSGTNFYNIGEARATDLNWLGARNALWDVGGIVGCTVEQALSPWYETNRSIDKPWIKANFVVGLHVAENTQSAWNTYHPTIAKKLIESPRIENVTIGPARTVPGSFDHNGIIANAAETLTRFDALEVLPDGRVRRARDANPYIGQALNPASAGQSVFVITKGGQADWVRAKVSSTVPQGAKLIVDSANPGRLRSGGRIDNYLAITSASITSGNHGPVVILGLNR